MVDKKPIITLGPKGRVEIDDVVLEFSNLTFIKVIGTGGSGIVLLAHHIYIDRLVAVKLWLKLKSNDKRNKFAQGIEEAKKVARLRNENIVQIYDAGEINGVFYAFLEYIPGTTLEKWLTNYSPSIAARWHFSRYLLETVCLTTEPDLFHGDLHTKNILVHIPENPSDESPTMSYSPTFKIIDFGTSLFTSKEYSLKRHWKVFNETFNKIMYPLYINRLFYQNKPSKDNISDYYEWYSAFLDRVPYMLANIGADWVVLTFEQDYIANEKENRILKGLLDKKKLVLEISNIGRYKDWWI